MHNYIALKIEGHEFSIRCIDWVIGTIEQLIKCCSQKELAKVDKSLEPLLGNYCALPPHEYYRVPIHFIRELIKIKDMKCKFSGFEIRNVEESFAPFGPPGNPYCHDQLFTYHAKLSLTRTTPETTPYIIFVNLRTNQVYNTQISYLNQPIDVLESNNKEVA